MVSDKLDKARSGLVINLEIIGKSNSICFTTDFSFLSYNILCAEEVGIPLFVLGVAAIYSIVSLLFYQELV